MPRLTWSGNSSWTNLRPFSPELRTRVLENAKLINLAELRIARPDPCVSLPCIRSVSMLAALSLSGQSFLCREASPSATRMFYSQLWVHTPPLPGGTHPVGTPLPRCSCTECGGHRLARWWSSGIASSTQPPFSAPHFP